jgi:hypothetical protein
MADVELTKRKHITVLEKKFFHFGHLLWRQVRVDVTEFQKLLTLCRWLLGLCLPWHLWFLVCGLVLNVHLLHFTQHRP